MFMDGIIICVCVVHWFLIAAVVLLLDVRNKDVSPSIRMFMY